MEFADFLKRKRLENGLSIRQLALYSDVSAPYLSQIERGQRSTPSPDILKKISKPLRVPYEELMEAAGYFDAEEFNAKELSENEKELLRLFDELPEERRELIMKGIKMMINGVNSKNKDD